MKNKYKMIPLFIFGIISLFIMGFTDVHASTLTQDYIDNVYYTRRGGGKPYMSAKYSTYTMDGKTVYCIEPGVDITTHNYVGATGWVNSPYSDEINQKIQLIGYYGYEYPAHKTLRYRMAAQSLIWETTGGQIIEFWTEPSGYGEFINLNKERNDIMRLVNAHYEKPSFNGETKTAIIGQPITFEDTKGILSQYEIHSSNGATSVINGNTLTITPNEIGEVNVSLRRKSYTSDPTTIFVGIDQVSQKMGFFGLSDPIISSVKLNVYGGRINIKKVDSETDTTTPQGDASLIGAKYNVIDSNGNVVDTLTIGSDSTATTKHLPLGNYTIREISASTGYYLNNTIYTATITSGDTIYLVVEEEVIKNYVSILKQYDYVDGNTTFLNAEANITFEIFSSNGNKYGEITTDKNGYATLELPYGVWKFHQVNSTTGFEKIYDFYVTVNEDSELEQYYNILNNKISAYLKVVKIDSETGKPIALANTTFKILNTDTNQFVSQYVGGKVYSEFSTDETGTFTTYLKLEAGNFRLIEVSSPSGYLISKDGLNFTIGEDTEYYFTTYGAIVVEEFENDQIKGQVEIFKTGESFVIENGTFNYETISLNGIKYNLYADEDIKTSDGNYLYYNKGDLVEVLTTNNDGYVISKLLPLGKYYLVEVETKDNYILDTTEHHFELTEIDNKTAIVYETHKQFNYLEKGTLVFTKVDLVDGTPIPNTLLQIYTDKDELVFEGLTDSDGKIVIDNLFVGKYYIVEKNAVEGYVLNNDKVYFEIKDNGEIVKAEMTNKKITSTLKITKVDEEENKISGVKFGIFDLNDNLISEHITDDNGYFEIELNYGKYYLMELSTLDQYIITDEKIYFEVFEDGSIIENIIINEFKRGTLEFTKVDLVDGTPIPNTLLQIYTDKDELVFEGLTDSDGKIVIEELKYGKYYIVEKEPNTNYQITDEKVYFEILEDGKIVKATMTNEKIIVEVPNTSIADSKVVTAITIISIIAGLGFVIYDKKRKK